MTRYTISLELDEGVSKVTGEARTPEQIIKFLQLALQKAITNADVLLLRADIKEGKAHSGGHAGRDGSTPGRKPTNRPKVEAWIRANIVAGPSTQGTVGLEGVDRNGFPKDLPNRVFVHRLALPIEEGGCGVSKLGIQKVLTELEVEGYLERGFAAGAPFYELIRPLEEPGKVGVRGRPLDEEDDFDAPSTPGTATPREVDFSNTKGGWGQSNG